MSGRRGSRPVYSTAAGSLCPHCGWPVADCRCSSNLEEVVPASIVAVLRLEKAGRGGKSVTVVDGLPKNRSFVRALQSELQRACATGGAAREGAVELQGDHRERLRTLLAGKGWKTKG